jgi:hypothetical protein
VARKPMNKAVSDVRIAHSSFVPDAVTAGP